MRRKSVALAVMVLVPALATGQEFSVNTFTADAQEDPAIAVDAAGNLVIVWSSRGQDGSDLGIFGRRFDPAGAPLSDEFQVNSFTSGRQSQPAVASDAAGNIVVVWSSDGNDGSDSGVFARYLDPSGMARFDEFQVNSFTSGRQSRPAVGSDAAGNVVVVWSSDGNDGSGSGIFAKAFDAGGNPRTDEFQINAFATDNQDEPSVASDTTGNFVVAWSSAGQDGSGSGVFGRRFDPSGAPISDEFQANVTTADAQLAPAIASDAAGNFFVVWKSVGQDGSEGGIYGRRFDASGTPVGDELQLNSTTAGNQDRPAAAADASGNLVVVWDSADQDGSGLGVFGRTLDPAGAPTGDEFPVNTTTAGDQSFPAAAASSGFVVVWQSADQDGSGTGIVGRKF